MKKPMDKKVLRTEPTVVPSAVLLLAMAIVLLAAPLRLGAAPNLPRAGHAAYLQEQELGGIQLPPPDTTGGVPLMRALWGRKTSRAFRSDSLPAQTLSNLLWAAFGVNRPEEGKRTAPSAVNWQDIDLYVVLEQGVFLYDAAVHELDPVRAGDIREMTGTQPFVGEAPVTVVLVSDLSRIARESQEEKNFYSAIDAGFISQNIYLYCASAGLATGVRALIDRPRLSEALGLTDDQKIIVAQSVGYPAS